MIRRPPRSTRTDTLFPYTTLFRSLLVQDWGLTDALAWNDPAWSISAEFAAYLLFPLLARAIDWRRVPTPALIAAIAAFLTILGGVMARADAPGLGWEISTFGVLRCLTEFSAGTALCALWLRWAERPLAPAIGSAVVAAALLGGWAAGVLPEVFAVPVGMANRKSTRLNSSH